MSFETSLLKPVFVTIHFCPLLAKITGRQTDRAMVNDGCPFAFLFESLLIDYPEIEERYPPESDRFAFWVNETAPEFDYPLKDGDQIYFWIFPPPGMVG